MFLLREACERDEEAILGLAEHLNTLNLPPERAFIRGLLQRSMTSFAGAPDFDPRRQFLFVLEDPEGAVVGTSMVHAQHGTLDEPHVFFRVIKEERYASIPTGDGLGHRDVHMVHTMLHLGHTYNGPSELGGLVLHPGLRRHPGRLGRLLSLGRLVFVASARSWFRDRMLAELLPPLYEGPEGKTRSPLWDALGSRFTGLSYDQADRLSMRNKDFIWRLFPSLPVHASLLPEGVISIIGQVGPSSAGAERLLRSVGFEYAGRVDPFDGGPHYEAATEQITIVRDSRTCRPIAGEPDTDAPPCIVAIASHDAPHFRAVWTRARMAEAAQPGVYPELVVPPEALARLGALSGAGQATLGTGCRLLAAPRH
ncbi:MAG: arginine N-succinyltransferase [Nannocystaceae bacterium]|nr:arginine N-succinyltransferase [Myxococcales bacterium]